jgi:hypothetical protein
MPTGRKFGNGVNDGARLQVLEMLHGSRKGFSQKGILPGSLQLLYNSESRKGLQFLLN